MSLESSLYCFNLGQECFSILCCILQVDYVDKSRNQVALKMLPRIDYTRKRGALRGPEDLARKRKRGRAPAKLFDQDTIK